MDDKEIIISVHRSFMNTNRYVVMAKYIGIEHLSGEGYAENDLFSRLRGRSLQDEMKRATCDAVKNLKVAYDRAITERDHMNFLTKESQLYVKECIGDNSG
jgi:hypothetical protein